MSRPPLPETLDLPSDRFYTEEELDAIEAVDPELAFRIARAQSLAQRHPPPGEGPPDPRQVQEAIDEARDILRRDGGDIELVGIEGRTVRVRLKGACAGCPRSALDLKMVVERLVKSRAPGVEAVVRV